MLGWLSQPETGTGNSGVIVLPPTGYPYLCAHRALRVLAERPPGGRWLDQLAATGVPVTMLFAEALDEIDLSR
jgi:hypothetical protein